MTAPTLERVQRLQTALETRMGLNTSLKQLRGGLWHLLGDNLLPISPHGFDSQMTLEEIEVAITWMLKAYSHMKTKQKVEAFPYEIGIHNARDAEGNQVTFEITGVQAQRKFSITDPSARFHFVLASLSAEHGDMWINGNLSADKIYAKLAEAQRAREQIKKAVKEIESE